MCKHAYVYACVYACAYVRVHMCVCVHAYMHAHIHAYIHACTHTYMLTGRAEAGQPRVLLGDREQRRADKLVGEPMHVCVYVIVSLCMLACM